MSFFVLDEINSSLIISDIFPAVDHSDKCAVSKNSFYYKRCRSVRRRSSHCVIGLIYLSIPQKCDQIEEQAGMQKNADEKGAGSRLVESVGCKEI